MTWGDQALASKARSFIFNTDFNTLSYTSHKKERKPQKPGKYICQYCSRPCAKPSVLQKHIRSHTGERPYPCGPCGFSFKIGRSTRLNSSHKHRYCIFFFVFIFAPSYSKADGLWRAA